MAAQDVSDPPARCLLVLTAVAVAAVAPWLGLVAAYASPGTLANPYPGSQFAEGAAMREDGELALLGGFCGTDPAKCAGQVEAYAWDGGASAWVHEATLMSSDGSYSSLFGHPRGIAIEGDVAVIGAPQQGTTGSLTWGPPPHGAAYVFRRTAPGTWVQEAKLTSPDSDSGNGLSFGLAVDIEAGRIAVGAPSDDVGSKLNVGQVHLFTNVGGTWKLEQKVSASDAGATGWEKFGSAVDLDGTRLLVGDTGNDHGYVFDLAGGVWSESAILHPAGAYAHAGYTAALEGDYAVIGDPNVAVTPGFTGRAHIFWRQPSGTWVPAGWADPPAISGNSFGTALDLVDGCLAVSGMGNVQGGEGPNNGQPLSEGSVHVFALDGPSATATLLQTITDPAPGNQPGFGRDMALGLGNLLVAEHKSTGGSGVVAARMQDCVVPGLPPTPPAPTVPKPLPPPATPPPPVVVPPPPQPGIETPLSAALAAPTPLWDTDLDGKVDVADNCPSVSNWGQAEADGDGRGDACDDTPHGARGPSKALPAAVEPWQPPDTDKDGVADPQDNCVHVPNREQQDRDGDGRGDACEPDPDGDGVLESGVALPDNCLGVSNADQRDGDADGLGDACDATPQVARGAEAVRAPAVPAPRDAWEHAWKLLPALAATLAAVLVAVLVANAGRGRKA